MIAEEYNYNYQPQSSIPKGTTVECIIECFKKTVPFFKTSIIQPDILKPLNENKLTQIFVEQLKVQLRKKQVTFDVSNQYSDVFFGIKGVPDFYFHTLEEGKIAMPLFIVEAKRLPAPQSINETEYVKGQKNNGGIERFKTEKHGKGLLECGMIGYIEKENATSWLNTVNMWIKNLIVTDSNWDPTEVLNKKETTDEFSYLLSVVNTKDKRNLVLHHFWLELKL